ncbi:phosphopantetheine-binding protein [Bacillus velezensis]|uniref:phosphopantetheine-binding protein n=1 Tax=Bacillus velezensis TaxID=492670 RepID=UPI0039AEE78F
MIDNLMKEINDFIFEFTQKKIEINDNLFNIDYLKDSMQAMKFIIALEKKFNIEFEDDDLDFDNIKTPKQIYILIRTKLNY